MDLRRLLNVTYRWLTRDLPKDAKAIIDRRLTEKFDYEMTPKERRQAEYLRMAEDTGAIKGQKDLMGAFGMKPA